MFLSKVFCVSPTSPISMVKISSSFLKCIFLRFVYELRSHKYKASLKFFPLHWERFLPDICRQANNIKMFEVYLPKWILIIVFFLFSFFVLPVEFDDCKGNNKLNFEVSNPDFKVERDGSLVALKNISEAGRALFVHARSEHAEDMAEILIVGANEKHGALKVR